MAGLRFGPPTRRSWFAFTVLAVLVMAGGWLLRGAPLFAQNAGSMNHAGMNMSGSSMKMSDAEMARWVKEFYKTHPEVGRVRPLGAPVDTFNASGTTYDADHNASTVVDTVRITTNQEVLWRALSGSHTVTSGTGSSDPNVGQMFDVPIDPITNPQFSFVFATPGTYPFFCRPHELFGMKGVVIVTPPVPADTFTAAGTAFDTDHNAGTQVDTAYVTTGQTVLWQDLAGIHTVTNGTGSLDPAAGTLFDVSLDVLDNSTFVYEFDLPGTYPFFCRNHETFNMRGIVVVTGDPVAVGSGPASQVIGFASEPQPNPTTHGVSFRLAMPTAGRASVRVFDARGQLVAVPLDRDMGAGVWNVTWDGSTAGGARAASGVYYLRLAVPGYRANRSVVLTH